MRFSYSLTFLLSTAFSSTLVAAVAIPNGDVYGKNSTYINPGGPIHTEAPSINPGGPIQTGTPSIHPGGPIIKAAPSINPGGPTIKATSRINPGGPIITAPPTINPGGTLIPASTPGCDTGYSKGPIHPTPPSRQVVCPLICFLTEPPCPNATKHGDCWICCGPITEEPTYIATYSPPTSTY